MVILGRKSPIARLLLVFLLLWGIACSPAVEEAGEPGDVLLIRNVTIIDGTASFPLQDAAVLISGNRILRKGPKDEIVAPEKVRIYDGGGRFLIPGLWDMHTHVLWQPFVADGFLRLFLVNGVTGIRDMGGTLESLAAVRPGGDYDSELHPRIVAAGPWLNPFVIDPRTGIAVESPEEARRAVASLAKARVDFIKVYLHLTRDQFRAILEESAKHRLPVAGHVPIEVGSREASDSGMRSIEHMRVETGGFCQETGEAECEELFAAFRRNGTWQTPTLVVRRNGAFLDRPTVADNPNLRFAPGYLREEWDDIRQGRLKTESFDSRRDQYAAERDLAGALHRAQVPILAGSDAGDTYCLAGFSLHDELELLVEAGLSTREALRAATSGPAEYLEATRSLGTIDEGKLADLVLLDANPLEDIRNSRGVHAVVRDGRLYDRAELDRILDELATQAQRSGNR